MALFNYKHPSQKEYYQGNDNVQQSGAELYGEYQFTSLADIIRSPLLFVLFGSALKLLFTFGL